jgi:hypothetical protein
MVVKDSPYPESIPESLKSVSEKKIREWLNDAAIR